MYTTFLTIHIVGMIVSVGLMSSALVLGVLGKMFAAKIATIGTHATIIGGFTGVGLLFSAPLTMRCAVLAVYLLAIFLLYKFGFAAGDASRAHLIRRSSVFQDT